jgi:hypothetical protein
MCVDFVNYYPRENFNGLRCGRTGGTDWTECKEITIEVNNPIPDGDVTVAAYLSVGGDAVACASNTTVSQNTTNSAAVKGGGSALATLSMLWVAGAFLV